MFRFTIRELVLLTLVMALGVGWWLDRRRLALPLAKLAEYERVERYEQGKLASQKRLLDEVQRLLSDKAIREYGAPAPKPLPAE